MTVVPRYLDVAAQVRQAIALGDTGPAGILESEATLARRFSVSRVTIRKALGVLREEGLIESRQGSGWYAVEPLKNQLMMSPTEVAAHEAAGGTIQRQAIETRWRVPPATVRTILGLGKTDSSLCFRRINSADGRPYDLATTWLPPKLGRLTSPDELARIGVWAALARLGATPVRTEQSMTATIATKREAELLGLRAPLALLLLRRVGYAADDHVVALTDHRYPGGRVQLAVNYARMGASS
jgi:DNA-binding GntR family transcriptional regulator